MPVAGNFSRGVESASVIGVRSQLAKPPELDFGRLMWSYEPTLVWEVSSGTEGELVPMQLEQAAAVGLVRTLDDAGR